MKYRERRYWKYQVEETQTQDTLILTSNGEDYQGDFLSITKDGFLKIFPGYCWDGPSGPTIDTRNFMTPSLVHDALYQLIREAVLPLVAQKQADTLLRDMCRERGMSWLRSRSVYYAVRWFGHKSLERPVLEAP